MIVGSCVEAVLNNDSSTDVELKINLPQLYYRGKAAPWVFICNGRGSDELCSSRERVLDSLQLILIESFSASNHLNNIIS